MILKLWAVLSIVILQRIVMHINGEEVAPA